MPQLSTLLTRVVWAALIVLLLANLIATRVSDSASHATLMVTIALFFAFVMVRLAVAAAIYPSRRLPVTMLAAGALAWMAGALIVRARGAMPHENFPAPVEWLFLAAYIAIMGFLFADPDNRRSGPHRAWWDVAVICGAAWCTAALVLVVPVRMVTEVDQSTLLVALMYPFIDVLLGLIVLSQLLLRVRTDHRQSLILGAATVALICADAALAWNMVLPTYDPGRTTEVLRGIAWVLFLSAACRAPQPGIRAMPQTAEPRVLLSAGVIAVVVLVLPVDDTVTWYAVPPAIVTLVAVGARMVLALRDATHATAAVELSRTDDLTTLPNRRAMHTRLARALQRRRPFALMLLDLDGFKDVNDALGHHAGDTVLRHVATRMQSALGDHVMVARLGGDEFAILMDADDPDTLVAAAHHILATLSEPVLVDGLEVTPSGSIGIAIAPEVHLPGGRNELLRRADVAMYQAKNSRAGATIYDAQLDEFSRSRLQLAEDLRRALAEDQIEVWYQPQLDAHTRTVTEAEALVRWRHPERGVMEPSDFLPAARRMGLMGRLSDAIARQAVRDLTDFLDLGLDLRIALNCAPPELLSQAFLPHLYAALEEFDVPAGRLLLEITEESFVADPERAREVLTDARSRGIEISIDDYGTGFSSLTHLRSLPVNELKIDQSLIRGIRADERSRMIVASTIQLAHALDVRAVAEGVEDPATFDLLVDLGIDSIQGYVLSGPMPAATFTQWLQQPQPWQQPDPHAGQTGQG